jgi:hypothetical protein
MSKKTFALVSGIVGALETAAVAVVTYLEPANAAIINSSIVVACSAVITICTKFVEPEPEKK